MKKNTEESYCDRCGKKSETKSISYETDSETSPCGDVERCGFIVDYCFSCTNHLYYEFIQNLSREERESLIKSRKYANKLDEF